MDLIECRRFFQQPRTSSQRQYEALRAYFIEGIASAEAARRFGYTAAAFRMLCYDFRRGLLSEFFAVRRTGPQQQPKKDKVRDVVVALRKRNYSIYDISHELKEQGTPLGATAVREILAEEGFAPLPRRLDAERPVGVGPTTEAVADVRTFTLKTTEFTTRVGGLFLFIPDMIRLNLDAVAQAAKMPGSRMIPAEHALRSSLALKLWSIERKSHVMALVADQGLALFCGLNAMPKRAFWPNIPPGSPRGKSSICLPAGMDCLLESRSSRVNPSISTFTQCLTSATIRSSNPTIYQSEVAGSQVFSLSSPRMPIARSSATQTPISARARRRRRSSASLNSGPTSTAVHHSIWSSTPSSPPTSSSIGSTRRESLSLLYAAVRQH